MNFKQDIIFILEQELNTKGLTLEVPPDHSMGDYSFACFKLSQALKKAPQQIAEELKVKILLPNFIEKVETKGAYLNFFISKEFLAKEVINKVLKEKENYGKIKGNKKLLLEHTSINPTGPINIGRIRNSFIGDTLVRLYKTQGYKVSTHFYVNDVGKQVAIIAWAKTKKIKPSEELEAHFSAYKSRPDFKTLFIYVPANNILKEGNNEQEVLTLIQECEAGDKKALDLLRKTADFCLQGQLKSLARFGINYDSFDFESKFIEDKSTESVISRLSKLREAINLDDAKALDLSEHGFERRGGGTVFARKNGTSVYITRDIAYHEWKLKQADNLLTVLGEDHKVEFNELKKILSLLNDFKQGQDLNVVFLSFVNLKEGRLSTREGRTIPIDEVLDNAAEKVKKIISSRHELNKKEIEDISEKVAASAIRYYLIKIQPLKPILFDIDEALSFEGETGPYLLYSYVRASKIVKKAGLEQKKPDFKLLSSKEEQELLKLLGNYPEVLKNATESQSPNTLAKYTHTLAFSFSSFYENKPVLSANENEKIARIYLVKAFMQVISNCFETLGMEKVESM